MIDRGLVSCENAAQLRADLDTYKEKLAAAQAATAAAHAASPARKTKNNPTAAADAALKKTAKAAAEAQRAVDALTKAEARRDAAGARAAGQSAARAARQAATDSKAQARADAAGTREAGRSAAKVAREASVSAKTKAREDAAATKATARDEKKKFTDLNSFSDKGAPKGGVSPWATHAKRQGIEEAKIIKDRNARMKAAMDEVRKMQAASRGGGGGSDGAGGGSGAPKDLKYLLKHAGVGKAAMGAAGAAGGLELTKLALGYRGMAMLSGITTRASIQFRQLFKGVDPMPVVRAADRFFQIFNKAGPAGKALSSIFDHAFNGVFGLVERAEPTIQAFFEGAIVGALKMETAWYQLRTAMLPITDAIDEAIGPIDDIGVAATAGGLAIAGLTAYAVASAAPFVIAGAAVGTLVSQLNELKKAWDTGGALKIAEKATQIGGTGIVAKGAGGVSDYIVKKTGLYDKTKGLRKLLGTDTEDADAGAKGPPTGKAYVDGIPQGVDAGLPGVSAAGGRIVDTLDKATRAAGQIHSPSRVAAETGKHFPEGTAKGIDEGADDVAAAAARSMVPRADAGGGSSGGAMGGAEVVALLRIIATNTTPRPMGGGGTRSSTWEDLHTIAHVLAVPA